MKKTYLLSAFFWCLLALAACGKEIKETEDESRYYEIRGGEETGQLKETESGQFLLGEEAQSAIIDDLYLDMYFPTNKSISDRLVQAELEYGTTTVNEYSGETVFIPGRYLGRDKGRVILEEQAVIELCQVLSETRSLPYKTVPLLNIISEEAAYYFNGAKSMEDVISLVQNRVQLYLDEHKAGR